MSADPAILDASAAGAAMRAGSLTPSELLAACLARIDALDGRFNCFVLRLDEAARAAAAEADARFGAHRPRSALDGIPVALKDNIDMAGRVTGNGMDRHVVAREDAPLVARLRAAGAVIVGKLNMHEGALGGTTDNPHHGPTRNPWDPARTPGGSSGGSGAAVAARLVPVAIGTDTMGSVRLPAAYCGVAGLKPTTGLVSTRGIVPLSYRLDHAGPLARSVRDLARVTAILAGADPRSPESVPAPDGWQAGEGAPASLQGCRIGVPDYLDTVDLENAVGEAFAAALEVLKSLGARISRVDLGGYDPAPMRRAGLLLSEAEAAHAMAAELEARPAQASSSFRRMLAYGRDAPAGRLVAAQRRIEAAGLRLRQAFDAVDLLVSPTAPQVAFPHGGRAPDNQADLMAIANFGRCPALSLPCALSPDGLPVGLQLTAAPWREAPLLGAAATLEAALGLDLVPPGL